MQDEDLMKIAVYVWEIRKATKAKALGRKALEKAILELEQLRIKARRLAHQAHKPNDRSLAATMESLFDMTENDILDHLAAMPSGLYDLTQFAENV